MFGYRASRYRVKVEINRGTRERGSGQDRDKQDDSGKGSGGGGGCVIRHLTSRSSWFCVWVCACWILSGGTLIVVVVPVDVVVDDGFNDEVSDAVGCVDDVKPADVGGRVKVG